MNGVPAFENRFKFSKGLEIGIDEQTAIQAIIADFAGLGAATQCSVWLWGLMTRPVR
jgi:hypothetical protein